MSACTVEFSSYMKLTARLDVETPSLKSEFPKAVDVLHNSRAVRISQFFSGIKKLADRLCEMLSKVFGPSDPRSTSKKGETAVAEAAVTIERSSPPASRPACKNVSREVAGTSASSTRIGGHRQEYMAAKREPLNGIQHPENQDRRSENEVMAESTEFSGLSDEEIRAIWTFGVHEFGNPAEHS